MHRLKYALPFIALAALGGCTTVGSLLATGGQQVASITTTAPPSQAKTVKDAILIVEGVETGLDIYVTTGNPSKATLDELAVVVPALHNTLLAAETAQRSGSNAAVASALAAFNEALAVVQAYKAQKGIPQ